MSDPTLAELVPPRTRRRSALTFAGAVLVLVAAAFSPWVLRPGFGDGSGGAGWSAGAGDRTLVLAVQATPRAWPAATITGVVAPAGTHVVGAWALDTDAANAAMPSALPAQTGAPQTWREAMGALVPVELLDATTALPQRVTGGRSVTVAMALRVDDCAALAAQVAADDASTSAVPLLRWRSVLGTPTTSKASASLGPASETALDALRTAGVCP